MIAEEKLPFDGVPLLNLDEETGKAPPARLTKPGTLRDIFTRARSDDKDSAANRADMQSLLDGEAPYSEQELTDAGCSGMSNLNFRGAEQQQERAMAPYWKLLQSTDDMVVTPCRYGEEEDKATWEQIIAEEITRTFRENDNFVFQTARLLHKFLWEGVGVAYFRDSKDWRYRAGGLGQFYFPRQSFSDETEHEVITMIDEMSVVGPGGLYRKIANASDGEAIYNGWNVKAVKGAIKKASAAEPAWQDWERLTDEIKNGDLAVGNKVAKVRVVHGFIQEFDGTVSHYIVTEQCYLDSQNEREEDFLYIHRGKYKSVREVLVMFTYGIGTNTKTHGVRGLGYKIYPFEQQFNRSMNRAIDAGMLGSSLLLKSNDENGYAGAGYQTIGHCSILDPEYELVQFSPPDLQRSVMPVVNEMRGMRNERTAGYSADNVFDGDQRKTKFEVAAGLEQNAQLSDVEQEFFYLPFERLIQESVKRLASKKLRKDDPGGEEAHALRVRLQKRGVPLEAFYQIDFRAVKVVRAIGGGSAAAKTLAYERLGNRYNRMDDVGRANYDWDVTVDEVGSSRASRYFAKDGARRTTYDTSVAILQNDQLLNGVEIPVLPSDRHIAHAREHARPLVAMFEAYELGEVEDAEAAVRHQFLYAHAVEHVSMATGDPATQEEVAALNELLQRVGEVISNGLKAAKAQEEKAAMEEMEAPTDDGTSIQQIAKVDEARLKLDLMREEAEAKKAIMIEQARVKNSIADATAAAKIARDRRIAESQPKPAAAKKAAKKAPKK